MNKYRLSVMFILIIIVFLYIMGAIDINDKTNFALTLAALIFSVSSVIDTFGGDNKIENIIRMILDTVGLGVAIILPNLSNVGLLEQFMNNFNTNVLLLLALFFMMAGQWATEIKIKDIKRKEK